MTEKIVEHGYAVLTRDVPEQGLRAGDVGVVVHIHMRQGEADPIGYMLETFTVDGEGLDVVSVPADAVRATTDRDVATSRQAAAEQGARSRRSLTAFGMLYAVESLADMPSGRSRRLRSVWVIRNGETVPRLVTAYPVEPLE